MYTDNQGLLPDILILPNGYTAKFFIRNFKNQKYINHIFREIDLSVTTTAIIYNKNNEIITVIDDVVKMGYTESYFNLINLDSTSLNVWTCCFNNNSIDNFKIEYDKDYIHDLYVQYEDTNVKIRLGNNVHIIRTKERVNGK